MRSARSTLVLATAFVLAGAAFDSPSFYVPGLALALLACAARAWVGAAARGAGLEREPGPWSVVEGDSYALRFTIRTGRLPLPGGRLAHPLVETATAIGMRSPRRVRLELTSLRRGRRRLVPASLLLGDPLGLHTAEVRSGGGEVLVLPRIEPVVAPRAGNGGNGGGLGDGVGGVGAAGLDTSAIDFELDGLRPYRDGTPASRIHWPTVARTGEMIEHRLVAGADTSPLVVLDSSDPLDPDALDRAVRAAASLCVHLAPARGCALLLSGERVPREVDAQLRAWPQVHARLAVVEGGGSPPAIRRHPQAGTVFWVTPGRAPPPGALPGSACFLVAPTPPSVVPAAFTVAGCHGQLVGSSRRRGPAGLRAA